MENSFKASNNYNIFDYYLQIYPNNINIKKAKEYYDIFNSLGNHIDKKDMDIILFDIKGLKECLQYGNEDKRISRMLLSLEIYKRKYENRIRLSDKLYFTNEIITRYGLY